MNCISDERIWPLVSEAIFQMTDHSLGTLCRSRNKALQAQMTGPLLYMTSREGTVVESLKQGGRKMTH